MDWENWRLSSKRFDQELRRAIYKENCASLRDYIYDRKQLPSSLEEALQETLEERLSSESEERKERAMTYLLTYGSGETNIVKGFDGKGGWVYNPESGEFALNLEGMEDCSMNLIRYLNNQKANRSRESKICESQ